MYTLKLVEFTNEGTPSDLFILANNIKVRKFHRYEKEIFADFLKRAVDAQEPFFFNPAEDCNAIITLSYFDDKGDYKTTALFPDAIGYIMNEKGKTIERIVV